MKRVIYYLVVLATIFTVLSLTQDYTAKLLIERTGLIFAVIGFLTELVLVYVLSRKIKRIGIEVATNDTYTKYLEDGIKEYKENEDVIEELTLDTENLKQRIATMIAHDNARIKLGDEVTRTSYFKVQKVYGMKLTDTILNYDKPLYQFVKGGKFYKQDEIRKIEPSDYDLCLFLW